MANDLHIPVLLNETLHVLQPKPGDLVVDCTVGIGGHAAAIAEIIGESGHIVGFDLDRKNLEASTEHLKSCKAQFTPIHANFAGVETHLVQLGLRADVVLADLGFSSNQVDDATRGLSFSHDAPLDMRLDTSSAITAADVLATCSERELADLIHDYGEEPLARKIAQKLTQFRRTEPIRTTAQLARLVNEAYGKRAKWSRMNPATRTFMALRIAVNDELGALRGLLDSIARAAERLNEQSWLNSNARIAVISFHSLEDRMVKHAAVDIEKRGLGARISKKPIRPSEDECRTNPRARSAKLRAVRIGAPQEYGSRV